MIIEGGVWLQFFLSLFLRFNILFIVNLCLFLFDVKIWIYFSKEMICLSMTSLIRSNRHDYLFVSCFLI